ncbi:RagB/SusD family nutrient uptake outer membrane protein [Pedobacter sp. HMF7647]|uniref:RagB/SusD family nutrient uptake outer membrane protein n=1 Tax=Hufsiella arboris TaxID=2695275 RepID=A0A7K1YCJ2_9SPHI|nr:RagB/SusD family nutrient uptake outer membrane protein [Hufsiella arboris]MXV52101.1 RagB/SusD family nutrient uptake outer membrane protein [Hufsiella arboris]
MKSHKLIISALLASGTLFSSCLKDLDTKPIDPRIITSADVFNDPASYKQSLAKLYGSLTLTGQKGQFGLADISAPDEGTTSFLRTYWSAQEITTDECLNAWGDPGLVEYHGHIWSDQNSYNKLLYQRIYINIAYCNEFIRSAQENVDKVEAGSRPDIVKYIAEARFLRALNYSFAMDLWGNVPFVTEADKPGAFLPKQITRADLFAYIESELKAIDNDLAKPGANEYARADQAAAWTLLSRIYLNAEVYLGKGANKYSDCVTYCNKIIGSGAYSLTPDYKNLFLADNDKLRNEVIFTVAEDGTNTQNYGGVTYIIHAGVGGSQNAGPDYGIASGGWSGNRLTSTFVKKFADPSGATDKRAIFYTNGQSLEITHPTVFTEGYLSAKYKNMTSAGAVGSNSTFVDTDFPMFRLADVYLMYAEAVLRGGTGGDQNTALGYINQLRTRAYGNSNGNIASSALTLNFILDERARELYWEGLRRTDLIRYGLFTGGSYLWDWKGNVQQGTATDAKYNLFPIPASDLSLNTNLTQNPGY